jgi:hypothetical protein
MTYRVNYVAVKRAHVCGPGRDARGRQLSAPVTEIRDSRIIFREERAVTVEAINEQAAIHVATKHLPDGCDVAAQVANE